MTIIHQDNNEVTVAHKSIDNAGHDYEITFGDSGKHEISFQNGPVKDHGVNGITNEALLAVLIHRTKALNDKFPCDENKSAISYMENALALFEKRTQDRIARGVEGENKL